MASNSIGSLALMLSADSAQLNRDLKNAGGMVDSFGGDVRKKFDRMGADLARTNLMSTPFNVRRQAGLELAQEAAEGRRRRLVEAARERLMPTAQPLGRMEGFGFRLGSPFGSGAGNAMGQAGAGLDSLIGGLAKFGPHAAIAAGAIGAMTVAAVGLWRATTSFVEKAQPAVMERYNRAWNDMMAVLGHRLAPVVELVTDGVRLLADFLQTILPSSQDMREALAPLKEIMGELRVAFAAVAPLIKAWLVDNLRLAAAALHMFAEQMKFVIKLAREPWRVFTDEVPKLQSSFGAAAQQAQFRGLSDLNDANILAGFSQGKDPVAQLPAKVDRSNSLLERIIEFQAGMVGAAASKLVLKGV